MTNAGWYPDPAGQPQTYRYWDGQSWSQETTRNPYDPAPGSAAGGTAGAPGAPGSFGQEPTIIAGGGTPPPSPYTGGTIPPPPPPPGGVTQPPPPPGAPGTPGAYGGGGYGQPPYPPAPSGSGGGGKIAIIAVLAVVLIAILGVGGFFGVKALTGDDEGGEAGEGSSETVTDGATGATPPGTDGGTTPPDSPTDTSTLTPNTLQCSGGNPSAPTDAPADGQLHGGGLTLPNPKGYRIDDLGTATVFSFADSVQLTIRQIEEFWISLYALGGLRKDNGFDSPQQAAELITQCMTGSEDFYSGFTGRSDVRNGPVTVDGRDGHEIFTEVRVDDERVQAEGDMLHVVVVDTGDAQHYGLYVSMTPIGDQELIDRQEATFQQLTVD